MSLVSILLRAFCSHFLATSQLLLQLFDDLQDSFSLVLVEAGFSLHLGLVFLHEVQLLVQLLVYVFLHLSDASLQLAHLQLEFRELFIVALLIRFQLQLNTGRSLIHVLLDAICLALSVAL